MPDFTKILDILKASGWQTAAIAGGCFFTFLLMKWGILPDAGPTVTVLIALAGVVSALLTITAVVGALARPIPSAIGDKFAAWRSRRSIREQIPLFTDEERQIIAHLLHHNQNAFTGALDGGYAITLIARGFVVRAVRSGQVVDPEEVPYMVPLSVWRELQKHKGQFVYKRSKTDPWRIPWQLRH